MSYPMNVTVKRLVESGCRSREEVFDRLDHWAERYGFERSTDRGNDFIYRRGSHWAAIYTFDIRKVPTEVKIKFIDDGLGACLCKMTCGSWLQFSTDGDERRLSDEMDLLEASLKGAFTEEAESEDDDLPRERNRRISSQDIREGDGHGC